jgi:hypothetical protein
MDWGAIGAVGEIIGGVAVILSILYLAYQIRESRVQAVAESQRELLDTSKFYIESPRVCRRLIFLRGLANEQTTQIFKRSTRTRSPLGFNRRA